MAAVMRLARAGGKQKPFYHVVVSDSREKRDGRYIERVGTYDPRKEPVAIQLNIERVKHWLSCGVQPSDTVARLIKQHGLTPPPAPAQP